MSRGLELVLLGMKLGMTSLPNPCLCIKPNFRPIADLAPGGKKHKIMRTPIKNAQLCAGISPSSGVLWTNTGKRAANGLIS